MNLQLVDQSTHRIGVYCLGFKSMCGSGYRNDARIYADLDGPAYKAYFCVDCVRSPEKLATGEATYPSLR